MTGLQQEVLFYVFIGFFILVGIGSLAVLLGWIKGADKAFRKWAVGGFVGAVTAAVVGLFRISFLATPALITVTLLPPSDPPAQIRLDRGSYQYDEVTSDESAKVVTHKGSIVAAEGDGGGWQVRLPGVVADKAVRLDFPDGEGNSWVAGPFYPNVIQQRMRSGQKVSAEVGHTGVPGVLALMFVPRMGAAPALQQQATVRFNNYARPTGNQSGRQYYEWRVFVDEKADVLKTIQRVDYQLHPTFPEPFRSSSDRDKNFELVASGWGVFRIVITVHFTNGTEAKTSYMLDFLKEWPASSTSLRPQLDKIHVVEGGSPGVTGWVFDILVDGKPVLTLPKRNYDDGPGKSDYMPESAGQWALGDLKIQSGQSVRIEVNGKRTFGGDTATGAGTLGANSPLTVTVANKTSPKKGSFIFTFSAAPS